MILHDQRNNATPVMNATKIDLVHHPESLTAASTLSYVAMFGGFSLDVIKPPEVRTRGCSYSCIFGCTVGAPNELKYYSSRATTRVEVLWYFP